VLLIAVRATGHYSCCYLICRVCMFT